MKKIVLFLILSTLSFGKEYSLDNLIDIVKKNGNKVKYQHIEKDKLDIQEKKINLMGKNGVEIKATPSKIGNFKDGSYKKNSSIEAQYDIFSVGATDGEGTWVGIHKDLKDLLYSESKHEKKLLKYKKEKLSNTTNNEVIKEVIEVIKHFEEYQNEKDKFEFLNKQLPLYLLEYKNIKKKYQLNSVTKLELEKSHVEYLNLQDDIKISKERTFNLLMDFNTLYNIELTDKDTLISKPVSLDNTLSKINNLNRRKLKNVDLDKKIAEEEARYSKFKDIIPNLKFKSNYNLKSEEWRVGLEISTKLFNYDSNTKLENLNLKETKLRRNEIIKKTETEKRNLKYQLFTVQLDFTKKLRENKVKKMEYLILQKKYQIGEENLSNYLLKRKEYENSYLEFEKIKNKLQELVYEIKYRG